MSNGTSLHRQGGHILIKNVTFARTDKDFTPLQELKTRD
jgi:hypothetical protein